MSLRQKCKILLFKMHAKSVLKLVPLNITTDKHPNRAPLILKAKQKLRPAPKIPHQSNKLPLLLLKHFKIKRPTLVSIAKTK